MKPFWSYSYYSLAVQCLQRYKYVVLDKIKPEGVESGDLAFGSALHFAINGILLGDDGEELFRIYWASYRMKDLVYSRFKWEELRELGLNFCAKFKRLHAPKYEIVSAEVRLKADYEGLKLEGTPDFLGKYKDKISLRDFKTAGYNYMPEKQQIALQLNFYAYLVLQNKLVDRIDTLGYTVFNKGTSSIQDMTWDFDENVMNNLLKDMKEYCVMTENQTQHPKNPNACLMGKNKCEFFENCWGKNGRK